MSVVRSIAFDHAVQHTPELCPGRKYIHAFAFLSVKVRCVRCEYANDKVTTAGRADMDYGVVDVDVLDVRVPAIRRGPLSQDGGYVNIENVNIDDVRFGMRTPRSSIFGSKRTRSAP